MTPSIGHVCSSTTTYVNEVGESLGWISYLSPSRSLCLPVMDGMWVLVDDVPLHGIVEVVGDVGIELCPLPLLTNVPPESHHLYMHPKLF